MSYLALYRKHRPQTFAELVGQEAIARTLSNAITQSRLAHAYLFTGPRGTGKTSTARILAMAINCEEGPTVSPCGKCANCLAIKAGNSLDVHEIDAASNRGIDDIRDLRERVRLAPVAARQKVYIIDEVHMLTQEAFNALLKTLEEPPPNLLFVLATTEPHKVLATIHSRCQRMDFNRIPVGLMADHLGKISAEEGIRIERPALELIARRSGGGLRDGLSLLDQISAVYAGEEIHEADVASALGMVPIEGAIKLAQAIAGREVATAIAQANELVYAGFEHQAILRELIEVFRHLSLLAIAPESALELPQRGDLLTLTQSFKKEELLRILDGLAHEEASLRQNGISPTIGLELALIKLCAREETVDVGKLLGRIRALEERIEAWNMPVPASRPEKPAPPESKEREVREVHEVREVSEMREPADIPEPPEDDFRPPEKPEAPAALSGDIDGFLAAIKRISIPVAGLLSSATLNLVDGTLSIALPAALEKILQDPRKRQTLEQAMKDSFGQKIPYRIEVKDARAASRPAPPSTPSTPNTPSSQSAQNMPQAPSVPAAPEPPRPPQPAVPAVPAASPPAPPVPTDKDLVEVTREIFNGRIIEKKA